MPSALPCLTHAGASGAIPSRSFTAHRSSVCTEVALGRLDGHVPEQELNLVQLATREMLESLKGISAREGAKRLGIARSTLQRGRALARQNLSAEA